MTKYTEHCIWLSLILLKILFITFIPIYFTVYFLSRMQTGLRRFSGLSRSLSVKPRFLSPSSFILRSPFCSSAETEEQHEFKAETRKLLDIVTNSIYTDKEVFLRELISNSSDALEKLRYLQATNAVTTDGAPLEINIDTTADTIVITDNGIGMSKEDLVSNLGTIARSGSKAFVDNLKNTGSSKDADSIIGQFGVGFYSSFMVSDTVSVESNAVSSGQPAGYVWKSDGTGAYTVRRADAAIAAAAAPDTVTETESEAVEGEETPATPASLKPLVHGSRITMHLKDSCREYADSNRIKSIIKKYSNFVAFPIKLNGEVINTVNALWTQDKSSITEQQYEEFYKYISSGFDKSRFILHFRADAPIELKVLLFFPTMHTEKFGMGRMEPGVSLYSRKVLIENNSKDILPDWCRFVKGVVDSEDLPLSLSRENSQDSNLVRRIRDVLVRKIVRYLSDKMKNDKAAYDDFYKEFQFFIKEGICHEHSLQEQLAKLLMFESNLLPEGTQVSLDDYVGKCSPEQKDVYYLVAPNRQTALQSPYLETFKKKGVEVLFLYHSIDDFVMNNLRNYNKRNLVSIETSDLNMPDSEAEKAEEAEENNAEGAGAMSQADQDALCGWLKDTLGSDRIKAVKVTKRLSDSPCIVTDHESAALRRMMRMVDQVNAQRSQSLPPQTLEINIKHPIMVTLAQTRESEADIALAKLVAEQLYDNALVAAGLIEDPREMLPRLTQILSNTRLSK